MGGVCGERDVIGERVPLLGERERVTLVPHGPQAPHVARPE